MRARLLTLCLIANACSYVYDGELEAQMVMVHDANKKLLAGACGVDVCVSACMRVAVQQEAAGRCVRRGRGWVCCSTCACTQLCDKKLLAGACGSSMGVCGGSPTCSPLWGLPVLATVGPRMRT